MLVSGVLIDRRNKDGIVVYIYCVVCVCVCRVAITGYNRYVSICEGNVVRYKTVCESKEEKEVFKMKQL